MWEREDPSELPESRLGHCGGGRCLQRRLRGTQAYQGTDCISFGHGEWAVHARYHGAEDPQIWGLAPSSLTQEETQSLVRVK